MTILETFIKLRDDLKLWVTNNLNTKANISHGHEDLQEQIGELDSKVGDISVADQISTALDAKTLVVTITESEDGVLTASHTSTQIYEHVQNGGQAVASFYDGDEFWKFSSVNAGSAVATFIGDDAYLCVYEISDDGSVYEYSHLLATEAAIKNNTLIVTLSEDGETASHSSTQIFDHIQNGGNVFLFTDNQLFHLNLCYDSNALFEFRVDEYIYQYNINDNGSVERSEFYIADGDLVYPLIVEIDSETELASHSATEIYNHICNGGKALLYSKYGTCYNYAGGNDHHVSFIYLTDDGMLSRYDIYNNSYDFSENPIIDPEYVDQAIANMVDSAPETLNTLNELAAALGNDENFATTVATQIGELESKVGDETVADQITDAVSQKSQVQMVTGDVSEVLPTLKIHKLTKAEYEQQIADGSIDENALYLTPDEEIDLSIYATEEYVNDAISSIPVQDVSNQIENHNINIEAHEDIRILLSNLENLVGDTNVSSQISKAIEEIAHPVSSINGKTGVVSLTASDVGALPSNTEIPSVVGLATEEYVNNAVAQKSQVQIITWEADD